MFVHYVCLCLLFSFVKKSAQMSPQVVYFSRQNEDGDRQITDSVFWFHGDMYNPIHVPESLPFLYCIGTKIGHARMIGDD